MPCQDRTLTRAWVLAYRHGDRLHKTPFRQTFGADANRPSPWPPGCFGHLVARCRHPGTESGGSSRPMRSRMARQSHCPAATSAIWKITYLACETTFAPASISFSRSVVSDQASPWEATPGGGGSCPRRIGQRGSTPPRPRDADHSISGRQSQPASRLCPPGYHWQDDNRNPVVRVVLIRGPGPRPPWRGE